MGALLELMADVTMLHPRSLHWRNSLSRIIYQFNLHFLVPQSHVHGTSQGKEKLKTSQLLMSSSESTSMEKLLKEKIHFYHQQEISEHHIKGTRGLVLICAICCKVSEKLKAKRVKKWH